MTKEELFQDLLECETLGDGLAMIRERLHLSDPMNPQLKDMLVKRLGLNPDLAAGLQQCNTLQEMVVCLEYMTDTTVANDEAFVDSFMKICYVSGVNLKPEYV